MTTQSNAGHTRALPRLALALAIACLAASAEAATVTWIGSGTNANWSTGGNWSNGVGPAAGDTVVWDAGSVGNLSSVNNLSNLSLASINYGNAPAGVVLSGSALTLTNASPLSGGASSVTFNLDMALPATATLGNISGYAVFNGVLSGAGTTLTVQQTTSASGFYAFNGVNTFSGNVVLGTNNGAGNYLVNTLRNSGTAQSLGTGSLVQFGGANANDKGWLYYTGGQTSTNKGFRIGQDSANTNATGGVYANGSGALTWSGAQVLATSTTAKTFTLGGFNTDTNTWSSAIGNNNAGAAAISLTKAGRGTWRLSGSNTFSGTVTVNSGKLVLDYATSATVLGGTNAVNFGAGTLELKANSSGSSAQTLGAIGDVQSGLSTLRVDQNGGTGMAVTTGAATFTVGKSAVLFDLNGSAGSSVTIGSAIAAGAVNGRLLIRTSSGGYDFAFNSGTASIPLSARAASATLSGNNGSTTTDYVFTNTGSVGTGLTSAVNTRSLRIAPTQDNQTMTIMNVGATYGGGGAGLTLAGAGLLYDGGANNFTIASASGTNGVSVRNGNNGTGFTVYHMGSGKLTIGERVFLGYAATGTTVQSSMVIGLMGIGSSLIDWQGAINAQETGQLTISGAVVRISGTVDQLLLNSTATGRGSNNVYLTGGAVLEAVNGDVTRGVGTGAGQIQWSGDGGFSAYGGNRAVLLASGSTLTWGASSFVPSDNALVLSSPSSNSLIDFQNNINFTGLQRVVRVHNGSASVDARISGTLSSGLTGGLVKDGDGTLELTAANTYTGDTWVSAGRLSVTSAGSINGTSRITLAGSGAEFKYNSSTALTAPLTVTQGTLSGTGAVNSTGGVSIGTNAILSPGNSPGTLPIGTGLALTPGGTYVWETNSGTGTAGVAWDLINVTAGGLNLSGLSAGGQFTLDLTTLTASGSSGPMDNYTAGGSYTWRIFDANALTLPGSFGSAPYTAGTDITSLFNLVKTNWKNTVPASNDMSVKVAANGTGIDLVVVPEPATLVLAGLGIGLVGLVIRHRRRPL